MLKNINELFSLMPKYGGYHMALVDGFGLKGEFIDFANSYEVTLHIKEFNKDQNDIPFVKYEKFSFEDKRYNPHSVIYDFVYLCLDIEVEKLEEVVKKFYRTLKNAGYIYLFSKSKYAEVAKDILEKSNYLSINEIDDFLGRRVISAQKMHGWKRV